MIEELEDNGSPEVMISLRDLRVSYGEREILHGVSFDVMRGETMVIWAARDQERARCYER